MSRSNSALDWRIFSKRGHNGLAASIDHLNDLWRLWSKESYNMERMY
jgi:hypothetical protein